MTLPSSLHIALPPSFSDSFWSQPSYRPGLHALYSRLQAGLDENAHILAQLDYRTEIEYKHAEALATPPPLPTLKPPLFKNAGTSLASAASSLHPLSTASSSSTSSSSSSPASSTSTLVNRVASAAAPSSSSSSSQQHPTNARGVPSSPSHPTTDSLPSRAFRALESEATVHQSQAHARLARTLERTVSSPFERWSQEHDARVRNSWQHVDATLARFERQKAEVDKLRHSYEAKCRAADEAEDDARFAGGDVPSPPVHGGSASANASVDAAAVVSEKRAAWSASETSEPDASAADDKVATEQPPLDPEKLKRRETLRQQFGFRRGAGANRSSSGPGAVETTAGDGRDGRGGGAGANLSPPADKFTPLSPPRAVSAELPSSTSSNAKAAAHDAEANGGLKRSGTITSALSSALSRASEVAPPALQNLRAAVAGGLAAAGEARHVRLRRDASRLEGEYRTAARKLDVLRQRTEETLAEHYRYAERWEADRLVAVKKVMAAFNAAFSPLLPSLSASLQRGAALEASLDPAQSLLHVVLHARTGFYVPQVECFQPYYHDDPLELTGAGVAGFGMHLVAFARARALLADEESGSTSSSSAEGGTGVGAAHVRGASNASNASLSSHHGGGGVHSARGLPALPVALAALLAALEAAYADADRWPKPRAEERRGGVEAEAAETAPSPSSSNKKQASSSLALNREKRKAWIYDVPLIQSHTCREAIVGHLLHPPASSSAAAAAAAAAASVDESGTQAELLRTLARFDAPTLASTVRLWMLELVESLVGPELWETVGSVYAAAAAQEVAPPPPSAKASATTTTTQAEGGGEDKAAATGGAAKGKGRVGGVDPAVEEKIRRGILEDLGVVLGKLPKIHLVCLDAVVGHLSRLLKATPTDEDDRTFLNKLGLALGRAIIRPAFETPISLNSKAPTLLVMDLVGHYDALFPGLVERRAKEAETAAAAAALRRTTPLRKRTKPVDQRMSRTRIASEQRTAPMPFLPPKDDREGGAAGAGARRGGETRGSGAGLSSSPTAEDKPAAAVSADGAATAVLTAEPEAEGEDHAGNTRAAAEGGPAVSAPVLSKLDTSPTPKQGAGRPDAEGGGDGDEDAAAAAASATAATPLAERVLGGGVGLGGGARGLGHVGQDASGGSSVGGKGVAEAAGADDVPLSNVARLSRQFGGRGGGSGSGSSHSLAGSIGGGGGGGGGSLGSKPRGARPMGARPQNASSASSSGAGATTTTTTTTHHHVSRESRDLAPTSTERPSMSDRRRSWSRTMVNDGELVDGDGAE